ncbi:MAG: NYN domain-containing protein [Clostridiales bacterium]|nr:NYN domain-containing protein [Clostridiales bacterium]
MDMELKLAVLIDADNISDKYVKIILDETAKNGVATYKRIYGDWTNTRLVSWKNVLLDNSITPIQQYGYTTGKNATDSAMIIDAMDILYSGTVGGFCIVSSDSDFTRLAMRLRESGMYVIGMGESKTPKPFISACNQFKYLDILLSKEQEEESASKKEETATVKAASKVTYSKKMVKGNSNKKEKEELKPQTDLLMIKRAIISLVEECSDDDEWIHSSELRNQLGKRFPDFDVRNFGHSKFSSFVNSLNILDCEQEKNIVRFRMKK